MFRLPKDINARNQNKLSGKDVKKLNKQIGDAFGLSVDQNTPGILFD